MEQKKSNSTAVHRITVIDALRGFALLGVIITHMLQHYGIFSFPMQQTEVVFPRLDAAIQWLMQNVIMGRFINIFAFLFGLSFFIQMDSAARKGKDFRKRFIWRMAILFVIGVIGNCFYTGDILSIYALFGVLMVFMYKAKNWVLIVIASALLTGVPRILTATYQQTVKVEQIVEVDNSPLEPQVRRDQTPSFLNSAKHNLTEGLQGKLNYQFGLNGRGYVTFALFMLGLVVGRLRFFEQINTRSRRNIVLFVGFVIATLLVDVICTLLPAPPSIRMILTGLKNSDITPSVFVVMALRDINMVLLSGALAMGFIVLYQTKGIGKWLGAITSYGRMGLTNYEMQGVVGCIIFSMWGFGSVFGSWSATGVCVLGLVVYVVQAVISKYWLKYYLYGPFEWLWRSATYMKLQPLKRRTDQAEN